MSKDLYKRYVNTISEDKSTIDYCVSFIKSFRDLPPEFLVNTIWEELWTRAHAMSDLELAKEIVALSEGLTKENSLYGRNTKGSAYEKRGADVRGDSL